MRRYRLRRLGYRNGHHLVRLGMVDRRTFIRRDLRRRLDSSSQAYPPDLGDRPGDRCLHLDLAWGRLDFPRRVSSKDHQGMPGGEGIENGIKIILGQKWIVEEAWGCRLRFHVNGIL
jgi:hypothetical protein